MQAANPELSMSQIQQLTALAFFNDNPPQAQRQQQPQQDPPSADSAPAQLVLHPGNANTADDAAANTDSVPGPAVAARIQQMEQSALEGRLLVNNPPASGRQLQQTDATAASGSGTGSSQAQQHSPRTGSAVATGDGGGSGSAVAIGIGSGGASGSAEATGTIIASGTGTSAGAALHDTEDMLNVNNAATESAAGAGAEGASAQEGQGNRVRPGGSDWAASFIADARRFADAAQSAGQADAAHNAAQGDEQLLSTLTTAAIPGKYCAVLTERVICNTASHVHLRVQASKCGVLQVQVASRQTCC